MPGDPLGERFARPAAWLRECHDAGAIIASACSGALLLGEAGLLDGVDATTHWAYCDMLAARYPQTRVRPQQTLVVVTHGGVLDMVYRTALGLPLSGPRQSEIPNAGLNRVRLQGEAIEILNWADTGHLTDLPPQPVYDQTRLVTSQPAADLAGSQ